MIAPRMASFQDDTAVTPAEEGRFGCTIDPSWWVHYHRAPKPGPAEAEALPEREGRNVTFAHVRLSQEGRTFAVAQAVLAMHLRRPLPRPGDWVLGRYFTRTVGDGLLEEDAELFDTDGQLLAQSRQLALAR
jgi:acyl-CoA thioesterase